MGVKSQRLILLILMVLAPGTALAQSVDARPPDVVREGSAAMPPRPSMITNPRWAQQPALVYPSAALDAGIEGAVVVGCRVRRDGRFEDCEVVSETPAGFGFAAAAVEASKTARVHPRTVDGLATDSRATWTARFRLPSPMPELR